jgi:hypothetical protein
MMVIVITTAARRKNRSSPDVVTGGCWASVAISNSPLSPRNLSNDIQPRDQSEHLSAGHAHDGFHLSLK